MPRYDENEEVQAVLDVIFLSKNINWEFDLTSRNEIARNREFGWFEQFQGKYPERPSIGRPKRLLDERLRDLIALALQQAKRVREGNKAIDIYPLTAVVVHTARNKQAVELYLGAAGVHRVEDFGSYGSAIAWVREGAKDFIKSKGGDPNAKLHIVGDEYY